MESAQIRLSKGFVLAACLLAALLSGVAVSAQQKEVTLEDAIEARTDVSVLAEEAATLDAEIRTFMRKVIAKAEGKQMEANIYLTKDRYADSVTSYQAAGALYRQAIDGRKVLERLADAIKKSQRARMLAEGQADAAKLQQARRLSTNAEGYIEAGEFEAAIAEYAKAQKAYEALLSPGAPATLEEAVAARTSMLAVRRQVKDLTDVKPSELRRAILPSRLLRSPPEESRPSGQGKPKPGGLTDLLAQAVAADFAAADALENRQYTLAKGLFARAEGLYKQVAALQAKRDKVLAVQKTAEDSMKLADGAFQTEARPASFERGKQALADARKALEQDDLDAAEQSFAAAVEHFAKAHGEAELANELAKAQEAYAAAVSEVDEALLARHAPTEWAHARDKAADAEAKAKAADAQAATVAYADAANALTEAFALAKTKENTVKAAPIVASLEHTKDRFLARGLLAQLEELIPSDPRMSTLREKVKTLPIPKETTIQLGENVSMKLILIPAGKFTMGSPDSETGHQSDEGPQREVTITKPFYMGVYEVTQEQYGQVMGQNPSRFKSPQNPVESVSWNDAVEFCEKVSQNTGRRLRLPTEAEWEYACRAGTNTRFSFGESDTDLGDHAWCSSNSSNQPHPVGQKKPNAWKLYDMHGNVWEWCADWYALYPSAENTDPQGPASGSFRVLRGGSWHDIPYDCRCAARSLNSPGDRHYYNGFRCSAGTQ
ncbi:MAG TPA: SUMF1/EgtB/PvdO family nonheme iron enzyme [Phycisphaerae bacterium]|nr:SUMF1/EgtB/PvdO family nonheme iron enzyme [Phycisphaerae bacterium]